MKLFQEFELDGVDLDWEYPGQSAGHNEPYSPHDTANFLALLRLLRSLLPASARLTAAAQTAPFTDENGEPMRDASEFAKVLDWVLIMNYDVWGCTLSHAILQDSTNQSTASIEPGANAPLNNGCGNSTQPTENAVSAYEQWTSAGFPPNKLVLGVPSYGYISGSTATNLRARSTSGASGSNSSMVVVHSDEGTDGVQVQFRTLVAQGALSPSGSDSPKYTGSGGFRREWHRCTSTPWLRSEYSGQIITYDDPESLSMKAEFARRVGMLGVNMWEIHGDTDDWALVDGIRSGLAL